MRDLENPFWIKFKGVLFAVLGALAVLLIVAETRSWRVAALVAVAVWAFCRAYYFAFYVIEKYLDSSFRFSGLGSALKCLWRQGRGRQ